MDFERAINIAIACVMASHMENKDKRETIEKRILKRRGCR